MSKATAHMSMQDKKQTQLDQIAAEIVRDNVCPDLASRATHLVFGEGNPDADIIFIGEAPGRLEDETGRPFVGRSGQVLTGLLEEVGLRRKDVYITSILKYRPPKNRDPKPVEKSAFMPYLQAQLDVIRPTLIATLGRHAANCFLPDLRIGHEHGQEKRWRSYRLLPLYHPAVALYGHRLRATLTEDFAKIPQIIHSNNIK